MFPVAGGSQENRKGPASLCAAPASRLTQALESAASAGKECEVFPGHGNTYMGLPHWDLNAGLPQPTEELRPRALETMGRPPFRPEESGVRRARVLPAGSQWAGLPDSPLLSPCPLSSITEPRARRVHPITQKAAVSRPGPPCKQNYVQIPHPLGDMQVRPSLTRQRWAPRNLGRAGSRLLPTVPRPQLSSPGVRSSPYTSALPFFWKRFACFLRGLLLPLPPHPPPLPGPGPRVHSPPPCRAMAWEEGSRSGLGS